jgi:hypothetical protein
MKLTTRLRTAPDYLNWSSVHSRRSLDTNVSLPCPSSSAALLLFDGVYRMFVYDPYSPNGVFCIASAELDRERANYRHITSTVLPAATVKTPNTTWCSSPSGDPPVLGQGTTSKHIWTVPANTVSGEKVLFVTANADNQAPDRCCIANLLSFSTAITTLRRIFSSVHDWAPFTRHWRCSLVSYTAANTMQMRTRVHCSSTCITAYHYPTLLFVDRSGRRQPS